MVLFNAFGVENEEISSIASDRQMKPVLMHIMKGLVRYLGIDDDSAAAKILEMARVNRYVFDYEKAAHDILQDAGAWDGIPEKLHARSELIYTQVAPHLVGSSVLDFGCGDGKIGEMLQRDGFDVTFADVYEHPHIVEASLDFKLIGQNSRMDIPDNSFDNSLVLTVLHHSDYPLQNLNEIHRVTKPGGNVIVIESVHGVTGEELDEDDQAAQSHFTGLTSEQQRRACAFFDHFFNRVFYFDPNPETKVNMPNNYTTPENWKKVFGEHGLKQTALIHTGLDQPLGPAEYHTLHVLKSV